jgi:hypothetical protein
LIGGADLRRPIAESLQRYLNLKTMAASSSFQFPARFYPSITEIRRYPKSGLQKERADARAFAGSCAKTAANAGGCFDASGFILPAKETKNLTND